MEPNGSLPHVKYPCVVWQRYYVG